MLELSLISAVVLFAFVTSVTPGPNNLMLLASGAQFGFLRTLPHMIGISVGVGTLLVSVLIGLGALFELYPALFDTLKWVGVAYLLWLSWKLMSSSIMKEDTESSGKAKPLYWWQAWLFQFVNPKAWMMAVACMSTFTIAGEHYFESGFLIIALFCLVNFSTISLWAWIGVGIKKWLVNAKRQRAFQIVMGLATASTLFMII